MEIPAALCALIRRDDDPSKYRLHLRAEPGGSTLCGLLASPEDSRAGDPYRRAWTTEDGSGCRECLDSIAHRSREELVRWSIGRGLS